MRSAEFPYWLFDGLDSVGDMAEIQINEIGEIESIWIDGRDYAKATGEELIRAMLTERNIEKLLEVEFPTKFESYDVFSKRKYGGL